MFTPLKPRLSGNYAGHALVQYGSAVILHRYITDASEVEPEHAEWERQRCVLGPSVHAGRNSHCRWSCIMMWELGQARERRSLARSRGCGQRTAFAREA